jgi:ribosomal protein S18 acetylase RimI-like enzyme
MSQSDSPADVLTVAGAPAIPGLRFRRFAGPADFPAMVAVRAASQAADEVDDETTVADLAGQFAQPRHFDPALDVLLVEVEGQLIGYNHARWLDLEDGSRLYRHTGFLLPAWRGQGIGRAMVRAGEHRLRALAAEHAHAGPRLLEVKAYNTQPRIEELLLSEGYTPVRHFFEMVRPLTGDVPTAPLPPGLGVRPVPPAQYRAVWDAMREAFAGCWGNPLFVEDDYARWQEDAEFQPDLWQVAWEGEQVVGMVLNFIDADRNARYGRRRGYTEDINVRAPWRRRGLARALILRSLALLQARGMIEAALTVDTANTPALELYEALGYRAVRRSTAYRKELA